ncbi:MAG: hypothetical protein OXQ30_03180 [Boseongicola sp.]|nr:hypothetical protein [Boseongicola sp.]
MNTVIAFPKKEKQQIYDSKPSAGATLFMHVGKTTLIAHLVKPQGQRYASSGRTQLR